MEGRLSLPPPQYARRLPLLCVSFFGVGALMEWIMCKTGFYNVYSVQQVRNYGMKSRHMFLNRLSAKHLFQGRLTHMQEC